MAQLLLLMLGRINAQISILERGDSYRPLVELMGGRVIEVNLDGQRNAEPLGSARRRQDAVEGKSRISQESHAPHDWRRSGLRLHPC